MTQKPPKIIKTSSNTTKLVDRVIYKEAERKERQKPKDEKISMFDEEQLLKSQYYCLFNLQDNSYDFSMAMNVPTDGWSLLYSIQFALLIQYGRKIDLHTMRSILLLMLEKHVNRGKDLVVFTLFYYFSEFN